MTQNPASSAGTGDAFADWMLGYPASASRGNYATYWGGIGTYWHFYAQDDWKVSDTLTLNPVSYTHLDVYKRQALHIAGWFDTYLEGSIAGYLALRSGAGTCLLYTSRCV